MSVIRVDNLTKDYGNRRGNFNVSFQVNSGEVFGFLGPNGAGKTTTIRQCRRLLHGGDNIFQEKRFAALINE